MTKNMYSTFHGKKKSYKVGNFVINPIIRGRTIKSVIKWDKCYNTRLFREKGDSFFSRGTLSVENHGITPGHLIAKKIKYKRPNVIIASI